MGNKIYDENQEEKPLHEEILTLAGYAVIIDTFKTEKGKKWHARLQFTHKGRRRVFKRCAGCQRSLGALDFGKAWAQYLTRILNETPGMKDVVLAKQAEMFQPEAA